MSDLQFIIICSFIIISIFEIISSLISYNEKLIFQKQALIEKSRREFGILRTNLFNLATQGKIDINSYAVQFLYLHLTQLVRRPDQFKEIIKLYIEAIGVNSNENAVAPNSIAKDIIKLPKEVQGIVVDIVKIIENNLLLTFAPMDFKIIMSLFEMISSTKFGRLALKKLFTKKKKETNLQQYQDLNEGLMFATQ